MRKYNLFEYQNGFCVPACLQSILDRRNFQPPSQKEIANYFEKKDNGLDLREERLNDFLKQYRLEAKHRTPVEIEGPDLILKSAFNKNLDVFVAYSYSNLINSKKQALHASLIADFNEGRKEEVLLVDWRFQESFLKYVSLSELVKAIIATESVNSGFYLIGDYLKVSGSNSLSQDPGHVSHSLG